MSRKKKSPLAVPTIKDREKVLESQMIESLRIRGIYCQKIHSGAIFVKAGPLTYKLKLADKGTPDIFSCVKGRMVLIEVKAGPEEQAEWERQWQAHLATADARGRKVMKKSWERSIWQHTEHEKWRASGATIIVCSSVDELMADIDYLIAEFEKEDLAIKSYFHSLSPSRS